MTKKKGIAQLPLLAGILLMAVMVPVTVRLIQNQQNIEKMAEGSGCPEVTLPENPPWIKHSVICQNEECKAPGQFLEVGKGQSVTVAFQTENVKKVKVRYRLMSEAGGNAWRGGRGPEAVTNSLSFAAPTEPGDYQVSVAGYNDDCTFSCANQAYWTGGSCGENISYCPVLNQRCSNEYFLLRVKSVDLQVVSPTVTPTSPASPGNKPCSQCDVNGDGLVCSEDIEEVFECLSRPNDADCQRWDMNRNGRIEFNDYSYCAFQCSSGQECENPMVPTEAPLLTPTPSIPVINCGSDYNESVRDPAAEPWTEDIVLTETTDKFVFRFSGQMTDDYGLIKLSYDSNQNGTYENNEVVFKVDGQNNDLKPGIRDAVVSLGRVVPAGSKIRLETRGLWGPFRHTAFCNTSVDYGCGIESQRYAFVPKDEKVIDLGRNSGSFRLEYNCWDGIRFKVYYDKSGNNSFESTEKIWESTCRANPYDEQDPATINFGPGQSTKIKVEVDISGMKSTAAWQRNWSYKVDCPTNLLTGGSCLACDTDGDGRVCSNDIVEMWRCLFAQANYPNCKDFDTDSNGTITYKDINFCSSNCFRCPTLTPTPAVPTATPTLLPSNRRTCQIELTSQNQLYFGGAQLTELDMKVTAQASACFAGNESAMEKADIYLIAPNNERIEFTNSINILAEERLDQQNYRYAAGQVILSKDYPRVIKDKKVTAALPPGEYHVYCTFPSFSLSQFCREPCTGNPECPANGGSSNVYHSCFTMIEYIDLEGNTSQQKVNYSPCGRQSSVTISVGSPTPTLPPPPIRPTRAVTQQPVDSRDTLFGWLNDIVSRLFR